jgi:hypothetical protein
MVENSIGSDRIRVSCKTIGKKNHDNLIDFFKRHYEDWRRELLDISPVIFVLLMQGIPSGQTLEILSLPNGSGCGVADMSLSAWLRFVPATNAESAQTLESLYSQEEQDMLRQLPCPEKETFSQTVLEILSSAVNDQQETRHSPSQEGDQQHLGHSVPQNDNQAHTCPAPLPIEDGAGHAVAQPQQDFGFSTCVDEQDNIYDSMINFSTPSGTNIDAMFADEFQAPLDPTYSGQASMYVGVEESYGGTVNPAEIHVNQPGLISQKRKFSDM